MKGKIYSWNMDKGFGFIQVENSERRVFAHISEFTHKHPLPKVGELVSFDLFSNPEKQGKFSAKNIRYLNRHTPHNQSYRQHNYHDDDDNTQQNRWFNILFGIIILGILAYAFYPILAAYVLPKKPNINKTVITQPEKSEPQFNDNYQTYEKPKNFQPAHNIQTQSHSPSPRYQCDGRTHCSQMNSCEEAKWFLRNCQNTEMDGDGDGIPCEQQWCRY